MAAAADDTRLRALWIATAATAAIYVLVSNQLSVLLFQDYASHLARAVVMSDLLFHKGARFGDVFEYRFLAVPYILGDIALAVAVEFLGDTVATFIWTALTILSVPLAMLFYLRTINVAAGARAVLFVLGLYLATDFYLIVGFLNFRFCVAVMFVALALAQLLRNRWVPSLYVVYCIVVLLGYLTHLAFVLFLAAAVGTTALLRLYSRTTRFVRECLLALPLSLVVGWHIVSGKLLGIQQSSPGAHYDWGTLAYKIRRLDWNLVRFSEPTDLFLALIFAACVLWPVRKRLSIDRLGKPAVLEMLVLAATFLAMYLVLPVYYGDPGYLDVRALVLVPPFIAFACAQLADGRLAGENPDSRGSLPAFATATTVTLALVLAFGNLVYLARGLRNDGDWLAKYREVVAAIPARANVLPVRTWAQVGHWAKYAHIESFVVTDRDAIVPTLFSGDRGQPMTYFRYLHRHYEPPYDWYLQSQPESVDWNAVACDYDFLLLIKPFDPDRIRLHTEMKAENSTAALLAIDRHEGCGAGTP